MKRTRSSLFKAFMIYLIAALQLFGMTAPILHAQETTEPAPCVMPSGINQPTGSAAQTYTWNCDTLLFENAYYTWNPNTSVATPKFAPQHTFNEARGLWEVREWLFIPPSNSYELRVTATYAPAPEPAAETQSATIDNTGPDSTNTMTNSNGSIQNTGPNSTNTINESSGTINNTGPDSLNTIDSDPDGSQADIDLDVDMTVNNDVDSTAKSGDASVLQNTLGGDATTGDALAMANILNMLQSTWGLGGNLPDLYTATIQGDYFGDIMIDPSLLSGATSPGCGCDLDVNASVDATINNNVNLLAQSGDATVNGNTTAGDARTGDATALANIVNLINSSIVSGQSFLGVLNISGNLNGDVLVAQDVIDELLAANVPTTELSLCDCDVLADFEDNQTVRNTINTTASSGDATVANNTTAGNATSGNAQTSVTVFNVTGRTIVGSNALLVFVNVLGEWVGFLVDAPSGTTAAMYGGDITQNSLGGNAEYDVDTNATINNNVNVAAHSGDARVSMNTHGGDATSGDADAAANVSNVINSNFSLSGWFGLLFINILGDWFGSFGVDTLFGDPAPAITNTPAVQTAQSHSAPASTLGRAAAAAKARESVVRVYGITTTEDEEGQIMAATASEITPPADTAAANVPIEEIAPFSGVGQPSNNASWLLLAAIALTAIYFFRGSLLGLFGR